jgi:hypothetical protein
MSPSTIPYLLCGGFCILPFLIGTGAFLGWCQLTNRIPSRDISTWIDEEGRKHVRTELITLTREERKIMRQPEEEE